MTINRVHLIKIVNEVEIELNSGKKTTNYICLEDEDKNMLNIWISDIISEELKKHLISKVNNLYNHSGKRNPGI